MLDIAPVRGIIGYVLVSLITCAITFQLTRPSIAQVTVGPLHVAATGCILPPTNTSGGDVVAGFSGVHVIAYAGELACQTNGQVRYIVLYQN
jgi:hypothetical protein